MSPALIHHRKSGFGSPNKIVNPVSHDETFQSGGSVSFAVIAIVPMIASEVTHSLRDPCHMGRWIGLTIWGRDDNFLVVITACRVCRRVLSSALLGTSFAREFTYLQSLGISSPNP
jgi:hypothetical protein